MGLHTFQFPGHPQETAENAVDLAHLHYVHGYDNVCQIGPIAVDGVYLKSSFDFRRSRKIAWIKNNDYDVSAVTHLYGLGYSFVEIFEKTIGMEARLWVLATPVDGTLVELVLVSQVREIRNPKRPIVGLRFLPMKLRHRLLNYVMLWSQRRDVLQDVIIWGKKKYRPRPRLSRADGEIATYRRYCQQFYPELHQETGQDEYRLSSVKT